jgi:hypothetical protein
MNTIGWLWILFLYVKVEMASEGRGREGLLAKRARLVFRGASFAQIN